MNAEKTDGYNVTAQGVADRTTDLKVNKMAADGSPLEGAQFTICDAKTGDADVAELNIYDAKLTATKWVVNKKTITKSRELTKTEPDKVITVSSAVQTGDEFNAVPLVILMAAAAAGLAAVMVLRKRTSEK